MTHLELNYMIKDDFLIILHIIVLHYVFAGIIYCNLMPHNLISSLNNLYLYCLKDFYIV